MGFKKNWDKDQIKATLAKMYHESTSPYNDGFLMMSIKKELYEIKWFLDEIMEHCHKFEGEKEFLDEHEKEVLLRLLKIEHK